MPVHPKAKFQGKVYISDISPFLVKSQLGSLDGAGSSAVDAPGALPSQRALTSSARRRHWRRAHTTASSAGAYFGRQFLTPAGSSSSCCSGGAPAAAAAAAAAASAGAGPRFATVSMSDDSPVGGIASGGIGGHGGVRVVRCVPRCCCQHPALPHTEPITADVAAAVAVVVVVAAVALPPPFTDPLTVGNFSKL